MTTSRRPLAWGVLLLGLALALVLAGGALRGPLNPACAGRPWAADCLDAPRLAGLLLQALALPVALAGGVLVAVWMARRAPESQEA